MRIPNGVLGLFLAVSVTACAAPYAAREPILCNHPTVDVTTNQGLARGLLDYHAAVELCNALNSALQDPLKDPNH